MMDSNIRFLNEEKTTFFVSLDFYRDKNPIGTLHNIKNGTQDFYSLVNLIELMNEVLDDYSIPDIRKFNETDSESIWNNDDNAEDFDLRTFKGKIATFAITVIFTQKSSWQGVVKWIEGDKELCFRSVLELISLIDNAAVTRNTIKSKV